MVDYPFGIFAYNTSARIWVLGFSIEIYAEDPNYGFLPPDCFGIIITA
jgi:hypothetical protein